MILLNQGQLTAFGTDNTVAWEQPMGSGRVDVVDGYLVLGEGDTLSVLRPN